MINIRDFTLGALAAMAGAFATNQPHTVRNAGTAPATYFVINWSSPGMLKDRPKAP